MHTISSQSGTRLYAEPHLLVPIEEEDLDKEMTDLLRRTHAKAHDTLKSKSHKKFSIRPAVIVTGITLCASVGVASATAFLGWEADHLTRNVMEVATATMVGMHAIQTVWTYRRHQQEFATLRAEEVRQKQIRLTLKQVDCLGEYHKIITKILKMQNTDDLQDIFFEFDRYSLSVPDKAKPQELKGKIDHLREMFNDTQIGAEAKLPEIRRYAQEEIRSVIDDEIPKLHSQLVALQFLSAEGKEEEREEEVILVTDLQPRYDGSDSIQAV